MSDKISNQDEGKDKKQFNNVADKGLPPRGQKV
jgi:hypothetical protein